MKYKLIKEFPNSPKLGTELYLNINHTNLKIPSYLHWVDQIGTMHKLDSPENYPEFWEKVDEKDYQITELTTTTPTINAVKRISDGVEFKLGDKVYNPKCPSQNFITESFYLDCNKNHMLCGKGHISITKIEHCKEPILITEDGVEVFDGDTAYWIDNDWDIRSGVYTKQQYSKPGTNGWNSYCKDFSTKEAAKEYIEENKPRFSKKEVLLAVKVHLVGSTWVMDYEYFKEKLGLRLKKGE